MDNTADVEFYCPSGNYGFHCSFSTAGDVNGDGYDDIIVGESFASSANIFYGGPAMDNVSDVNLASADKNDAFGSKVSDAGDVNKDGYDDVIVGAPNNKTGGASAGGACIYFGGPAMDNVSDVNLKGAAQGRQFGGSVSNAGDVDKDGYDDVIVGAPQGLGGAFIYSLFKYPAACCGWDEDIRSHRQ